MEMLEGSTAVPNEDHDEEYDEFAELDEGDDDDEYDDDVGGEGEGGGGGKRSKGKAKKKRRRKAISGGVTAGKKNAPTVPKYLKPRSLASILIEEPIPGPCGSSTLPFVVWDRGRKRAPCGGWTTRGAMWSSPPRLLSRTRPANSVP